MILVSGRSAGGMVRRVKPSFEIVCCVDSFVTGPLCEISDFDRFTDTRRAYWQTIPMDLSWFGPKPEFSIWDAILPPMTQRIRGVDRFEIWVGSDVQDTTFSIFAILYLADNGVDPSQVFLRHFHSENGHGLGVLNEEELRSAGRVQSVDVEEVDRLKTVWAVMCAFTQGRDAPPVPALGALEAKMLGILKRRWPNPESGLTNIQRYLLEVAPTERKKAAYFVGHAMGCAMDHGDVVGDAVLFEELKKMAHPDVGEPLFEIFGSGHYMRRTEAVLTPAGRAIQAQLV
ncbi:hypothetical protein OCA8868_00550 [Octadecabacter ascidiaceicola]|uniref:DUF1835 domain-containing protein n=2 Tax=Octadecabacter ascidiaceicola TaxID=1655543 RepID=A0A238JNW2_9RHOB|nr:hypothetical protein OCA8868_00550 [Octadecabacter ascidiaceicola]